MFRKMLVVLVVCVCFLSWNSAAFAHKSFLETVNLDGGFKLEFDNKDILISFGVDDCFGWGKIWTSFFVDVDDDGDLDELYHGELYDNGTNGDIIEGDTNFKYMLPYSTLASDCPAADFWSEDPNGNLGDDTFDGNTLSPVNVTSSVDELAWNPIGGDSFTSYWVGIWEMTHDFYHDGEVDFSDREADFGSIDLDSRFTETSVSDFDLGVGEYIYGIIAMGDGSSGKDGWSAVKGTLTVTPEPMSCLLFLLGGISLVFCVNRKKRRVSA